jgi:hypothetical protein
MRCQVDGLYHYDPYRNAPSTPAFAFGFGLGFTSFVYKTASATVTSASTVAVDVKLRNAGAVDGTEVVQVYCTAPLDNVVRYYKRLVGVKKVLVPAGEEASHTVTIDVDDLAVYTTATPGAPAAGERRVLTGEYARRESNSQSLGPARADCRSGDDEFASRCRYTLSVGGSSATDLTKTTFSL